MPETLHFINDGFGWACKRCRAGDAPAPAEDDAPLPRFFREGEAEDPEPRLASPTLARWKEGADRTLLCPRCGAEETLHD